MSTQIQRDESGNIQVPGTMTRRGFMVNAGILGLGAMALGPFLTACSREAATGTGATAAALRKGGTLTFAIDGTNGSLDPAAYTTLGDWLAVDTICSGLTTADFATNEIQPSLASGWTFSADGLQLTLQLREDVKFHDGTLLTSADVVRTFNRQLVDGDASLPTGASRPLRGATARNIKAVEAVDPHTVRLTLGVPDLVLPGRLSHISARILQAAQIDAVGAQLGTTLIGTGPYKLASLAAQQSITLEAFPDYFGGAPALDRLVFQQVADASTLTAGLMSAQVNASSFVSHSSAVSLKANKAVTVYDVPRRVNVFVMMNVTRPVLADLRVRKAINLAIDRSQICANAFAGFADEPKGYALGAVSVGYDPSLADLSSYDVSAAKALIAEAGATGAKVSLIAQNNNWYPRAAQILEENLKAIGLVPTIELLDAGSFSGRFFDVGAHDLALWERNGYVPDPDEQVGNLLSSTGSYGSKGSGVATLKDKADVLAQIDGYLRSACQTSDDAARRDLYTRAQRLYAEQIMALAMVCQTQNIVVSNGASRLGEASLASQRAQLAQAALTA